MNFHNSTSLLRTLSRAFFRSRQQIPSPTFFCASPYFLPILPTTTTSRYRYRYLSTTPTTPQQLETPPPANTSIPTPPTSLPPSEQEQQHQPAVHELLPLLRLQPSHYITIHINSFPFLVTTGDLITLPFLLPDVEVGDILRLTHATILGSRDYTIKGSPYIDENLFELRARVVEITSEPMREKIKKKQRTRRTKTVKSKHKYTVLRIGELVLKDAPVVKTPVEKPVVETPVMLAVETPVVETLTVDKPVIETAVVETPVVETPVVEKLVVEKPVVETPVVETPAVETPVVETQAMETQAVETPVVEALAVEKPVVATPVEAAKEVLQAVGGQDTQPAKES